ncbi:MAG: 30S ribosomal protein S6e [DPANN group archaeon]|nr:30S ribosomal protein S6e [DPANN group archaeon]
MAEFKLDIGDKKTKRTFKFELKSPDADQLFGKKIGETFRGELLGLTGFEFQIMGGSDRAGFPMRKDVDGVGRRRLLLSAGSTGMKKVKKFNGVRLKKSIRGNTISAETAQVNAKIVKWGSEDLNVKFPPKIKEKPAEVAAAPAA